MRALIISMLCAAMLSAVSCSKTTDNEPEISETESGRPESTRPGGSTTTPGPANTLEAEFRECTRVEHSYSDFHHRFAIHYAASARLSEHEIRFGIKYNDNRFAYGAEQISQYSEERQSDTTVITMTAPFWSIFLGKDTDKFLSCDIAFEENNQAALRAYEKEAGGLDAPRPVASIDNDAVIICL